MTGRRRGGAWPIKAWPGAAILLFALAACNTAGSLFEDDRMQGQGGGTSGSSAVVGEWEITLVVFVEGDVQNWTTNWIFRPDGTCRFRQTTESGVEGVPRVEQRSCTWRTANGMLTVTYTDTGQVLAMKFDFAAFDPNRLVLDGYEYKRIH